MGGEIRFTQSPVSLENLIGQLIFSQGETKKSNPYQVTGSPTQSWSAGLYAQHAAFVPDHGAAWVDAVVGAVGTIDGLDVLDVGCGDGALTQHLVARGAQVVGVDASDNLVAAAKSGVLTRGGRRA